MIPNVNPQQMYATSSMMPVMQDYPPQLPIPCIAQCPMPQAGVMPVYNSIPYNPLYANAGQVQQPQQSHAYSPKISTVSIELNGLEPPKVPGYDFQGQQPVYPGMTQMSGPTVPFYPYQTMPQLSPQSYQQIGMQPLPMAIPPSSMVGAYPVAQPAPQYLQQPQQEIILPTPQYAQQPQQVITPPPSAIDQASKVAAPATQQPDQEAVKPLIDALNLISPKQGVPELPLDQQEKAIQTIAQFARVAEASNQLSKTSPDSPDVKKTKENVDTLIKPNLIKEETFLALADIATKDTSKLTGEDKKKADENRIISMWTLAMTQKLFKQEMNEEAKKINIPPISMNEVPGIVQVADIVKKDANPEVRLAGIAALVNLADPQDKKDVETMRAILGEAQKDSADNVKNSATEALKMYSAQDTSAKK